MNVSVITPVYNAGKYLKTAVESALMQDEVEEVILIEDGSLDNSLDVCLDLEKKYEKVKLFRHSNGENRGAGETRNLGLKMATQDYIAFLDADDFYLEDRFKITKKIFENTKVDGVYEAIGVRFESEKEEEEWSSRSGKKLTTVSEKVGAKKLFSFLVLAGKGHFSLDGLTIKKRILDEELGLFNRELKISQDTHFCLKLALAKNLFPGSINKAVAIRRVHPENRITKIDAKKMIFYQNILWSSLLKWSENKKIDFSQESLIYFMQYYCARIARIKEKKINLRLNFIISLVLFLLKNPVMGMNVFGNIVFYTWQRIL